MASTNVEKDLKYVYGWNYYTMKFMGIWPEERGWKRRSNYLILIPILMILCFVCIPQTANIPKIRNDLYLLVENFSLGNITFSLSLLKMIIFWTHGKPLKSLLRCMATDWRIRTRPSDRKIMMNIAKISRKTTLVSIVGCNIVVLVYAIRHRISSKYTNHKLFFHAYFPYDVNKSPNLELTICGQFTATIYTANAYAAVDTFVVMLILHVCGQLSILKRDILNLPKMKDANLQIALENIVRSHESINRFVEKVENCVNMMLLLQMIGCTLQLCFQCFHVIMTFNDQQKELVLIQTFFLILYVIYIMVQLYLYCYVGERLTVESTHLATAAYNSEWYNLPTKKAKLLIIIMCRTKLPLHITAGKFCSFTLQLYSEILKRSMGYISVLYAMQNKN